MSKILIVEDEEKLRSELKIFLESNDYQVLTLDKFDSTIEFIENNPVDLILLDINLPNLNGEIICKEIRKKIDTPIIIVTSRNNELDELISINYGADDFITKPYNTQILLARIERIIKRSKNINSTIIYNDLILDVSKSVIIKKNLVIDLSKNEFKIFYYLLINRGKIVSRDDLMNYLWDNNAFLDDNTLTVNINRLRNKLLDIGYNDVIITKKKQGYIIL